MQRQFLPLDEDSREPIDQEFNLSTMTPESYLKQVRLERKNIPQVVRVAPLCSERTEESLPQNKDLITESLKSSAFGLSKEWRELQRERFAQIHQRIVDMREDQNLETKLSDAFDTSLEKSCIEFCIENEPTLSIMLALDQNQLEELLAHLSSYLCSIHESLEFNKATNSFYWITKWIYATSACLRSPLDPDVHNCLRMIAKSCIQSIDCLKSTENSSADAFLPWYLIIVIIALYYKQFDLLSF